jgi:hypothetical protein
MASKSNKSQTEMALCCRVEKTGGTIASAQNPWRTTCLAGIRLELYQHDVSELAKESM